MFVFFLLAVLEKFREITVVVFLFLFATTNQLTLKQRNWAKQANQNIDKTNATLSVFI